MKNDNMAAGPGAATPDLAKKSSAAPETCGDKGTGQTKPEHDSLEQVDEQRKRVVALMGRAALLGLILRHDDGARSITEESAAAILLASRQVAEALVFGRELECAQIHDLVDRLTRQQGVQA